MLGMIEDLGESFFCFANILVDDAGNIDDVECAPQFVGKDAGEKLNGTSILGRYLAKMRLKQWKDYRWKDTDFLRELAEKRVKESMEH